MAGCPMGRVPALGFPPPRPESRLPRTGDEVAYSLWWLRALNVPGTDPLWHARGLVVKEFRLGGLPMRLVHWDEGRVTRINAHNLAVVGNNLHFVPA